MRLHFSEIKMTQNVEIHVKLFLYVSTKAEET